MLLALGLIVGCLRKMTCLTARKCLRRRWNRWCLCRFGIRLEVDFEVFES